MTKPRKEELSAGVSLDQAKELITKGQYHRGQPKLTPKIRRSMRAEETAPVGQLSPLDTDIQSIAYGSTADKIAGDISKQLGIAKTDELTESVKEQVQKTRPYEQQEPFSTEEPYSSVEVYGRTVALVKGDYIHFAKTNYGDLQKKIARFRTGDYDMTQPQDEPEEERRVVGSE